MLCGHLCPEMGQSGGCAARLLMAEPKGGWGWVGRSCHLNWQGMCWGGFTRGPWPFPGKTLVPTALLA